MNTSEVTSREQLEEIKKKYNRKPKIALGIIGNVDSGKSTLAGHLLRLTEHLSEHEYNKLKDLASKLKDESFAYAYTMDRLPEERERGVTIKETLAEFDTKNRSYIISDLPGHAAFSKNFLAGASQLDLCLLMVDVVDGIVDQTKEHLRIIIKNGVKRVIVLINKMDMNVINYSEEKFRELEQKVLAIASGSFTDVKVIPISAVEGENIMSNTKMPWYTGKTLYEILDDEPEPELPVDKPLRLQVSEICTKAGIGTIITGKISQGIIKTGDKIIIKPSNKQGEIKSIEMFHKEIPLAIPNDSVGIVVRGVSKNDAKKGYLVCHLNNAPKNVTHIIVDMTVIHPLIKIKEASDLLLHYGTGSTAVKVEKVMVVNDKLGNQIFNESVPNSDSKAQTIERGQSATVKLKLSRIISIETAQENPRIGRCTLRNEKGTVAFAVVVSVVPHSDEL
jgi:translation elongation factor TU